MLTLMDRADSKSAGFSLLEVLIAIAIMAILVGIVTINAQVVIERTRIEQDLQDAKAFILESRVQASRSNRTISLADKFSETDYNKQPARVGFSDDAKILPGGVCSGGWLWMDSTARKPPMEIQPLTCELVVRQEKVYE